MNPHEKPLMNPPRPPASYRKSALLAFGVAVFAGGLRFIYLDAGLRHEPQYDEQVFVEEVQWMIRRGDWVPRFFEYPGLLFWILRVAFTLTAAQGADAYLAARAVTAAFSSAAVFGVAFLGCRWFSPTVGVFSGLLLALSPLSVETAHAVRPDEVIGALILAALSTAVPLFGRPHHTLGWCLAAAAVAIKFSAALVFPALFLGAVSDRIPMVRIARLALLAFATFVLASPWTFLAGSDSAAGMAVQVGYHYSTSAEFLPSLASHLTYTLPVALSWPGIGLALVGLRVLARSSRGQAWICFMVLWLLVFSSTDRSFLRFMVPILGALSLAAGAGLAELLRRFPTKARLAVGVWALAGLASSAWATVEYLTETGRPSPRDRALDWIEATRDLGRVASLEPGLGRNTGAAVDIVELTKRYRSNDLLCRQFDALVLFAHSPSPAGFVEVARFKPETPGRGRELVILVPPTPPRVVTESLEGATLTTSSPSQESKLIDGSLNTRWHADSSPAFIELTLALPARLARVELAYGGNPPARNQISEVLVDGRAVTGVSVRDPIQRQRSDRGASELLAFDVPPAKTLRIEFKGRPPFLVGELRLYSHAF